MNISTVRDAIETRLDTIGIRVYTSIPETVVVPCAIIQYADGEFMQFDDTFSSADSVPYSLNMKILVLAGRTALRASQDKLDDFLSVSGNDSIRKAITGDTDMGSNVDSVRVVSAGNFGVYSYSNVDYLGVHFSLEIIG